MKLFGFILTMLGSTSAFAVECEVSCYGLTAEYERVVMSLKTNPDYPLSPAEAFEVGMYGSAAGFLKFKVMVAGPSKDAIRAEAPSACRSAGNDGGLVMVYSLPVMYCAELHLEPKQLVNVGDSWSNSYWPTNDWK